MTAARRPPAPLSGCCCRSIIRRSPPTATWCWPMSRTAQRYRADIVATQRYAVPSAGGAPMRWRRIAAAPARRCSTTWMTTCCISRRIIPMPASLRPKAKLVQRLLRAADAVWVSTDALAARLASVRRGRARGAERAGRAAVGRIAARPRPRQGPVRILCMGTATHAADFAIIKPALERLHAEVRQPHRHRPAGCHRAAGPAGLDHPPGPAGDRHRLLSRLRQLADAAARLGHRPRAAGAIRRSTAASRRLKTLDYAALGMAVLASDVAVYRGSLADGPGGMLVPNQAAAWHDALSRLVRDRALRDRIGRGAFDALCRRRHAGEPGGAAPGGVAGAAATGAPVLRRRRRCSAPRRRRLPAATGLAPAFVTG